MLLDEKSDHPREEVVVALAASGIETRPGFIPFDQMPPYQAHPLPVATMISRRALCLPTYAQLEKQDVHAICREVKKLTVKEKSFF